MSNESEADRLLRLSLERKTRELASELKLKLPSAWGFALVLFDFGEAGSMAYASNGKRAQVVKMLRELLALMEAQ